MIDTQTPGAPASLFIARARGVNRITYMNASRISEVFDKNAAPTSGSICVIVHSDFEDEDPDTESATADDHIVALAVVRGIAGVASGAVRATLAPIHRIAHPVPLSDLQAPPINLGEVPQNFYSRSISSRTAAAVLEYLTSADSSIQTWLDQVLGEPRSYPAEVKQSRAEAKDAVQLAAQLANIELPPDAFISVPATATEDETLLQTVINSGYEADLEEELLPLDLQRFDGKLTGKQRAASVSVFTDKWNHEKLLVMSVNKKPIELELGVDLLYWDQVHDSFTFVQYKRLEKVESPDRTSYEWAYLRRGEIVKQLKLMPVGRDAPSKAEDWRAFGTPFWFKFVRGDAGSHLDDKTLKGMHVSADWIRLAVEDETLKSGPKGGFRVTYGNAKYIGRSAFTQLISRGFVGTTRARSKDFKKVLRSKDRELIIAVRTDWQNDRGTATSGSVPLEKVEAEDEAASSGLPF